MTGVRVISGTYSTEDMAAVVDALPDEDEQALHLLMTLTAAYGGEAGISRSDFLQNMGRLFDMARQAASQSESGILQ